MNLPAPGSAFAVPLADGRYCACRVLLDNSSEAAKQWKSEVVLVATSAWIGHDVPRADDPALRPILHLSHHSWKNEPEVIWVSEAPPDDFVPIGVIEPPADEQAIPCQSFGGWGHCRVQALLQWRWDHDRDAVLAEDAAQGEAEAARRDEGRRTRAEYLERVTLEDLRKHTFFPRWNEHPQASAIRASRLIMAETVERLQELPTNSLEADRMAVLQSCIELFNALDAELRFIETAEREDICHEFEAIVHACGMGAHRDLADEWRDW